MTAPIVEVVRGDITTQPTDAIVNAANSSLMGGGGVDGAIHAAAGPTLLEACRALRVDQYPDGLPTGSAVATTAGMLPAGHVIHTVGPRRWDYPDGGKDLLAACHANALAEARRIGARSVCFPAISCGVYGWHPQDAAPIAMKAVHEDLVQHGSIQLVRFVLFNDEALEHFAAAQ